MNRRPLVMLDAAGVLVYEDDLRFTDRLSASYHLDPGEVAEWFEGDAYAPWWSGRWQWGDFWRSFSDRFEVAVVDQAAWQAEFSAVRPMHSLTMLGDWVKRADIWLLSDHRSEWLLPELSGYLPYFQMLWISDSLGFTKREPAFFEAVSAYISPEPSSVIYVDDRQANLDLASSVMPYLKSVRADPSGRWTGWLYRYLAGGA